MIKNSLLHLIRAKEHWADLPVCYCGKQTNSVFRSTLNEQEWERETDRDKCQRCIISHNRHLKRLSYRRVMNTGQTCDQWGFYEATCGHTHRFDVGMVFTDCHRCKRPTTWTWIGLDRP